MAKEKIKLVCLAFWTPPIIRPRAILAGRMIPEMVSQGLQPVILTYQTNQTWHINLPVFYVPRPKFNKHFSRITKIPKEYIYYQKLFKTAKEIVRKHKINLVFSLAKPNASNILGAMLKQKLGIKFISHFSDPWYDNPYSSFSSLGAKRALIMEKYVVKNSDRIIFTNKQAQELVMKKYPAAWRTKTRVIPHCFNPQDYPSAAVLEKNRRQFVFSHIGTFYPERNPEIFLKAVRKLLDSKKELCQKIKIQLVGADTKYAGYSADKVKDLVNQYQLEDIVELIPRVSCQESLRYMKASDCLIVIDADFKESPFLPLKVVDYAGSGSAIIGITPAHSPTAEFLNKLGYTHFNYQQVDKMAQYLEELICRRVQFRVNDNFLQQFSVKTTVAKLIKEFDQVIKI